jgi:hypothetical protein
MWSSCGHHVLILLVMLFSNTHRHFAKGINRRPVWNHQSFLSNCNSQLPSAYCLLSRVYRSISCALKNSSNNSCNWVSSSHLVAKSILSN